MKTKKYYVFKEKNNKPLHDFISKNVFFAFSNEQFKEGLQKMGIAESEVKTKLHRYFGGGFILIEAEKQENKITKKIHKTQRKYLSNYKHLKDALIYEMNNHECGYTGDYLKSLYALGYSTKDFKNKKLLKAYKEAKKDVYSWFIRNN